MKRISIFLFFIAYTAALFAEKFQIQQVEYSLENTREIALKNKVLIDTEKCFENLEELEQYQENLRQKYLNLRIFDDVQINTEFSEKSANTEQIVPVKLSIIAKDSKNLLVVPYPKYDSNSGITVKLKAKNSNLFGNVEELSFDFNVGKKLSDLTEENGLFLGGNLNFTYPFYKDPFKIFWKNDFAFEYNFADTKPQFKTQTGLTIELPFKRNSLVFDLYQGAYRDFEYCAFDDDLYYKTYSKLSAPFYIVKSENYGNFVWSPFFDMEFNYDADSIQKSNDDLSTPRYAFGNEFSITKIDWIGNFRKGYSLIAGQKFGWNQQNSRFEQKFYGTGQFFTYFRYFGLNAKINYFQSEYFRMKIGEAVRGIPDKQKYLNTTKKALKTPSAITASIDIPVHILSTDWIGWGNRIFGTDSSFEEKFSWMKIFDFEFQISPFADFALTKNEATGRLFSYKDGWYSGGLEVLVYPNKWKSIVVRGSLGFDLGRLLINKKSPDLLDYSWRENEKSHEIYVGIGLQY